MKKLIFMICLLLIIVPTVYSLTASIGNARVVLRVNATPEDPEILERTLRTNNKNEIPVIVRLEPDDVLKHFTEIEDEEFVLQPGETKDAKFTLIIDRGGRFEGRMNVLFSPQDPESKENNVALGSNIIILSEGPIIPFPEEEEEEIPEELREPEEEEEVPQEEEEPQEGEGEEEEEGGMTIGNNNANKLPDDNKRISGAGPNPLTGFLIIAAIVIVGLIIYYIVSK